MQKRDAVAGTVGKPQAQCASVKVDRPQNIRRKQQNVGHSPRLYLVGQAAVRCPACSRRYGLHQERHLLVGRGLFGNLHLDQDAVRIRKPEAVRVEAGRRVHQAHALAFDSPPQRLHILLIGAKGDVLELFGRTFGQHAPAVSIVEGGQAEIVPICLQVEPKRRIEVFRDAHLRNGDAEVIERVHPKLTGAPGTGSKVANHRHNQSPYVSSFAIPAAQWCSTTGRYLRLLLRTHRPVS